MRLEQSVLGTRMVLSERNLNMLKHYGAIHKGDLEVIIESNEVHYSPEQEKVHQRFTDKNMQEEGFVS